MPDDLTKNVTYTGSSMKPTLKPGDTLQVIPYDGRKIRRGDVIIFLSREGDTKITHRVISIDSQGVRTRGDNNKCIDPQVLSLDNILGLAVSVQRKNRRVRIYGGIRGILFARAIRAIHMIDCRMSSLLRPFYYWLVQSGVFNRWAPVRNKIRVLSFKRSSGTELQLFLGRRAIGRLLPGSNQWRIQRPFRLFVDEESLPKRNPSRPPAQESRELHSNKKIN